MTVIAWDGKTLAADKQTNGDGTIGRTTKIFKADNGSILAFCGMAGHIPVLLEWYNDGQKKEDWPKFQSEDGWTGIVEASNGVVREFEQHPLPMTLEDNFYAWGSGGSFAIGAMEHGASAIEAVDVACRRSATCGGGCDSFDSLSVEIKAAE